MTENSIKITHPDCSAVLRHSALRFCATWDGDTVTQNWPTLSTGEVVLWDVLAFVNDAGDKPDAATIDAHLDTLNATYAHEAIRFAESQATR